MGNFTATSSTIQHSGPQLISLINSPDKLVVKGIATILNFPALESLYTNPVNYLYENTLNVASTINYALLSKIASLATHRINNVIQTYPLLNKPLEPLNFFATIGGGSLPHPSAAQATTLNLFNLAPHTLFLYYTTKKMKNNVADAFRSVSLLFKGLSSNKWSHQINRKLSLKNEQGQGYSMSIKISREYTWQQLSLDIIFQTGFAATWGALAGITYQGMSDAINVTGSIPAQHALTLMTTAIALYHFLPLINLKKESTPKSHEIIPTQPEASHHQSKALDFNFKYPFQPAKTKKNPPKSYSTYEPIKFDPTKYNPIKIGKERSELLGESNATHFGAFDSEEDL